jgi:uncharacterized protein with ParB-like and HNH nuclease domain
MAEIIGLKSISDLLRMNFFIPSYQRGYRWNKQQVEDLLDDICDFKPKEDEWYCLQPLVVKKMTEDQKQKYCLKNEKDSNEWYEVIDGQQRLTTIFLIIHYANQMWEGEDKIPEPTLNYETRKNSELFLPKIKVEGDNVNINDTSIDYFHVCSALKAIHEWVKNKKRKVENFDKDAFKSNFQKSTKVIWYETNENDAVKIFTRINMGKIPLTNAELIKALFLNSSNFKTDNTTDTDRIRLKQLEIANEWDSMEYSLHNEEFWWFINKDESEKDTRIEFLFELIIGKTEGKEDDTYIFRKYSEKFKNKSEKEIEENWKEVKRHFQILRDWFNNRELYHKVGYLITNGEDIKGLLEESQRKNKIDFLFFIDEEIKKLLANISLDNLEKKDDTKVRRILLLHNIQTMLENKTENTKFPFNRYKKKTQDNKGWDVEHIHAISTKVPEKPEQQEDWLKYAKEVLVSKWKIEKKRDNSKLNDEEKYKKEKTINELEKHISAQYDAGDFENRFTEISKYIGDEDANVLSNLALLDLGTNRGYKNEFFSYKRDEIIKKDKANTFVPICTKNAFMKYYTQTDKIEQMTFWGETDRTAYFENIKKILGRYLPSQRSEEL